MIFKKRIITCDNQSIKTISLESGEITNEIKIEIHH